MVRFQRYLRNQRKWQIEFKRKMNRKRRKSEKGERRKREQREEKEREGSFTGSDI